MGANEQELPSSPAAQRNKTPIGKILGEIIDQDDRRLLEVGSGTGEHGVFFSSQFPWLEWVLSDRAENHPVIKRWQDTAKAGKLSGPVGYEIGKDPFPRGRFDLVYTANTFHIMSWKLVKTFVKNLGSSLRAGARVVVYGPFKYEGEFTSESNEAFDAMLRERDPQSGVRSFEDVKGQMESRGFRLLKDYPMPANNRCLVFLKV